MKVIIIGAGEVGYHIADSLSREGIDTVVIDRNEERLHEISETLDVQTVLGSGSSPEVLKRAGMVQAEMVIAVTDSDETNMIACLLASTQCRIPIRIARIRSVELGSGDCSLFGTDRLNIDLRINPEEEAVNNVMDLLEYPGAAEVFRFAGGRIRLLGFQIDPGAAVIGEKISDLRAMAPDLKVLITAIVRGDKLIVPSGVSIIENGDYLFTVTDASRVPRMLRFFGKQTEPPRRIIIIGGGDTGAMLAEAIEKKNINIKIIEKKQRRCEILASRLEKTVVLRGDGTSQELLREENIEETDFFIAVTNDEEANILGALLAKQLGARKVISLINRIDYIPLVSRVGIDGVINPRHSAIRKILHYIRKGKVISVTPLRDDKAEAFEFIALETSEITGRPFKDIHFPRGTIVGAICRGEEVIIPDGNSVIRPGDHVVIFTPHSAIVEIEKLLTVKLEYFG